MTSHQSWRTRFWNRLRPLLDSLLRKDPFQFVTDLLRAWDTLSRLWDKVHYHGMYEILDYDSTLEILDPKGEKSVLTRREVIRFLQNNVVAIHDHAWGDGDIFAAYRCQPGVPVDCYEDGARHNILISLRETKERGDVIDLWVERIIRDGLLKDQEWLETEVDHWMEHLTLSNIFPQGQALPQSNPLAKKHQQDY